MDRRRFLLTSLVGVGAAPRGVSAQASVRPTVGLLHLGFAGQTEGFRQALRDGLREHGYVEGETIAIEYRHANGDTARLPSLATELLSLKVKVIVTSGTTSVRAVKSVTNTVPIVIALGADPVEMGFAKSLAQPGGNITGLSILGTEIARERLDLLHQAVPRARIVALLVQAANPGNPVFLSAMTTAAAPLGLQMRLVQCAVADDLPDAFAEMSRVKAEAAVVIEDAIFSSRAKQIGDLALRHRVPTMLGNRTFVYAGGLMAYGLVYEDLWRCSAGYVGRILKGANP